MQKSCCTLQCTIHSVDKHCYIVQITPSCIQNAGAVAQLAPSCIQNAWRCRTAGTVMHSKCLALSHSWHRHAFKMPGAVAQLAPSCIQNAGAVAQLAPSCIQNVGAVVPIICSQHCPYVLPLNCAHATFNMVRICEMCDSVCTPFSSRIYW